MVKGVGATFSPKQRRSLCVRALNHPVSLCVQGFGGTFGSKTSLFFVWTCSKARGHILQQFSLCACFKFSVILGTLKDLSFFYKFCGWLLGVGDLELHIRGGSLLHIGCTSRWLRCTKVTHLPRIMPLTLNPMDPN